MRNTSLALFSLVILTAACKKEIKHCEDFFPQTQKWMKYAGNPVFTKGVKSWDDGGHSIESLNAIGYAHSTDGIHWIRYSGGPVFKGTPESWEQSTVSIPSVLQDGNTLHMWYLGGLNPDGGAIGYATSQDGIHWNRHPSPVFQSKAGEWYADGICYNTGF